MGAWVNRNRYSPGKRHYFAAGTTRTYGRVERRGDYRYEYFTDQTNGGPLCGERIYGSNRPWSETGYTCFKGDKVAHRMGGLSVKETVNLLQSNLCSYCRKAYIADRPELKAAVEAVQKAQVMS